MSKSSIIEINSDVLHLINEVKLQDESIEDAVIRAVKCLRGFQLLKESEV
jgi:hypothetical protein